METRLGWTVSALVHLGIVGVTMISWPDDSKGGARGVQATPVEIVDIADVADVMALAPLLPDADAADEEHAADEEEPEPEPAPTPDAQPREPEWNPSDLRSQLIDRSKERANRRPDNARESEHTREGVGLSQAERATWESRIGGIFNRHIQRCWRMSGDSGAADLASLNITLRIRIDEQGNLEGTDLLRPRSRPRAGTQLWTAWRRAEAAASMCSPYPFPRIEGVRDHYDMWRENEYTFRSDQ